MTYSFYNGTTGEPSFTWQATYDGTWTDVTVSSTKLSTEVATIAIDPTLTAFNITGTGVSMTWGSGTGLAERDSPGDGINMYESGSFPVWGDYASMLVSGDSVMTIEVVDFNSQVVHTYTSTAVPEPTTAMLFSLIVFFAIMRKKRV